MKTIILITVCFLTLSCATINVTYDYDKATNFKQYKTYRYFDDIKTGLSALDSKRLFFILDSTLQAKGFILSDTPDFYIDIQSSEYKEPEQNNVGIGVGGGSGGFGGGISVGIPINQSKINRQIQFDFVDEKGIGLFWQAVSESSFNPNAKPTAREAQLKAIVVKVLQGYPPTP